MLLVPFGGTSSRARGQDDGNIPTHTSRDQDGDEDELNNIRDKVHNTS